MWHSGFTDGPGLPGSLLSGERKREVWELYQAFNEDAAFDQQLLWAQFFDPLLVAPQTPVYMLLDSSYGPDARVCHTTFGDVQEYHTRLSLPDMFRRDILAESLDWAIVARWDDASILASGISPPAVDGEWVRLVRGVPPCEATAARAAVLGDLLGEADLGSVWAKLGTQESRVDGMVRWGYLFNRDRFPAEMSVHFHCDLHGKLVGTECSITEARSWLRRYGSRAFMISSPSTDWAILSRPGAAALSIVGAVP